MEFKFKDGDKKTEDEMVENEATESEAYVPETVEHEVEGSEALETEPLESPEKETQYTETPNEETYAGGEELEDDDAVEKVEYNIQVGGSGTVGGAGAVSADPTATRPKFRIPTEEEEARRHPFRLPLKQIAIVMLLLGGGYYVKTYHSKDDKPKRIDTPQVVEIQIPKPKGTSIEELSGLLNESKELLKSRREREQRQRNQASAQRASRNTRGNRINFQALKSYTGQWVTIIMKDGLQRDGRITDVKDKIVYLEQDYQTGTISVRVPIQSIAEVRK